MTAQPTEPLPAVTWQLPRHLAAVPGDQSVREQAAVALLLLRDLPAALHAARIARGLTQADAAHQAGICHTNWSHLEHGRYSPSASVLRALLAWLAADHHPDGYRPPEVPQRSEVVERMRRARRRLGKTQREVGLELGVTKSAVSHWEIRIRQPSDVQLAAIVAWLDRYEPEATR